MKSDQTSFKVVLAAIITNFSITIAKTITWILSGSPSMMAEAIHSLADTANQTLIFVGIRQGAAGPSKEFPYGRGHARYLWSLMSAMGVFFIGFGVTTYHGVISLIERVPPDPSRAEYRMLSLVVLGFAFVAELITLLIAWRGVNKLRQDEPLWTYIRKGDDPTSVAVLLEDSVAVLGVAIAACGIYLSDYYKSTVPDALASIVIGVLLGFVAITLVRSNARLLLGASIGAQQEQEIREFIESISSVEKVTSLKTEVLGPDRIHLLIEVELHGGILIDPQLIERDAQKIRDGEDPAPILVGTAERMVRTVGTEINHLEIAIQREFPEVVNIELEIN